MISTQNHLADTACGLARPGIVFELEVVVRLPCYCPKQIVGMVKHTLKLREFIDKQRSGSHVHCLCFLPDFFIAYTDVGSPQRIGRREAVQGVEC